ncbi:hypothetical protein DL98DRAFT_577338 [Cadophora sp. DSE1049]|nr:hypothetical protein DL98DRAFT_577338 [Cadophora sp. DSE1049]
MDSQPRPRTFLDYRKAQGDASSHIARDTPDKQRQRSSSPGPNFSLGNSPIRSSKKRYRPSDNKEDPIATTETVKAQAYGRNLPRDFQVRMGLPWDWYKKVLEVEHLDNSITVAERKAPQSGLVAIKVQRSAHTASSKNERAGTGVSHHCDMDKVFSSLVHLLRNPNVTQDIKNHPAAYNEVLIAVQEISRPKLLPTPTSTPREEPDSEEPSDQLKKDLTGSDEHKPLQIEQDLSQKDQTLCHIYVEDTNASKLEQTNLTCQRSRILKVWPPSDHNNNTHAPHQDPRQYKQPSASTVTSLIPRRLDRYNLLPPNATKTYRIVALPNAYISSPQTKLKTDSKRAIQDVL